LTNGNIQASNHQLSIKIIPDNLNKTITISDTGVGITKHGMIERLGTIYRNGIKEIMDKISSGANDCKIGEYDLGFYASFLVADKVVVVSKASNDTPRRWESTGDSTFSISDSQ
jgi:HSP90 family molecular chaperone